MQYKNVFQLLQDIIEHVKKTGRPVEAADNPLRLTLGWRDPKTGEEWSIRLTRIKECPTELRECLKSADGRLGLVNTREGAALIGELSKKIGDLKT
jgi:hypothetical protein